MLEKYLSLKLDDIHMMACGGEQIVDNDNCDCYPKAYHTPMGKGLEELETLLNNLKLELTE
jgi:hypothetical protein